MASFSGELTRRSKILILTSALISPCGPSIIQWSSLSTFTWRLGMARHFLTSCWSKQVTKSARVQTLGKQTPCPDSGVAGMYRDGVNVHGHHWRQPQGLPLCPVRHHVLWYCDLVAQMAPILHPSLYLCPLLSDYLRALPLWAGHLLPLHSGLRHVTNFADEMSANVTPKSPCKTTCQFRFPLLPLCHPARASLG